MGKRTRRSALPIVGVLFVASGFFAATAAAQPVIHVGNGSGPAPGTATFSVTLETKGAQVAGTQNDITFDAQAVIPVGTTGYCSISGGQCSDDLGCPISPPPFTHEPCVIPPGGSTLQCATSGGSCAVDTDCPEVHEPCIPAGGPDCKVNPDLVKVCSGDSSIACTQNSECVGTCATTCSNDATKSCTQNSDCNFGTCIGKGGFFSFRPNVCSNDATKPCATNDECSPGTCTGACTPGLGGNCTGIRAMILAVNNLVAIPDTTLYSCNVSIASGATDSHTLTVSNTRAGDTSNAPINEACVSGHCATHTDITCTSIADCPSIVTGTNGTITVLPSGDSDGDGVPDATDNCPYTPNPDQKDTGGIGAGSPPDGIGDVCQCGDVNGNGFVTLADSVIILRSMLQPPTATMQDPQLCDVGGSAGCTLADAVIILRANLTQPTATVSQNCAPAKPH
jgi:hypothetical protein